MKCKLWAAVLLIFLMGISCAEAEYLDHQNSRQAYAQAIAALNPNTESFQDKSDEEIPAYTLVIFRISKGEIVFDEYEPDVLVAGPHGCYTAAYLDAERADQAVAYLKNMPHVCYAEVDKEVKACEETVSFQSDGAGKMGFGDAAQWCEKAGTGSVSVAVIDSGVYKHAKLAPRMLASGYDYVDGDTDATSDTNGHGTHVAGIVVDCTPSLPVYIKPIRVLNASGKGSVANTVSAVFEAAEDGCSVINLSLVSSTHSDAMDDAISFAVSNGTMVVVAAGNEGKNTSKYCPAHIEASGVIVVGSCEGEMDAAVPATYSNYGASVDVYAFGSSVSSCSISGGYSTKSGTSQAAAYISGLCGVMRLLFPSVGNGEMENRIRQMSGDGEANVPDASYLRPLTLGVTAEEISLPVGMRIGLMTKAEPALSFLTMKWSCENPEIASVDEDGVLTCMAPGTTTLHGDGPAKADVSVILHVTDGQGYFCLPESLTEIGEEAFGGMEADVLWLPVNVEMMHLPVFERIDTVIYHGSQIQMLKNFESQNPCFVVRDAKTLWTYMNEQDIRYLLDCSETAK